MFDIRVGLRHSGCVGDEGVGVGDGVQGDPQIPDLSGL